MLIDKYTVNHKHQDPVRYPAVINGYEDEFKENYRKTLTSTITQLTKQIVEDTKNHRNEVR